MKKSKLDFLGSFERYQLDNGLTVVLKALPDAKTVSTQVWLQVGSLYENDLNNGLAHFLEHMVFKGTENLSPDQINSTVEEVGGYLNAATSPDYTYYYTTLPASFWQRGLELLQQLTCAPLLPPDEFERERKIVLSELARYSDDPRSKLWKEFVPRLYSKHPYGRLTIGTAKILNNVGHEALIKFYDNYYVPERMIVIVTGDFPEEEVLEKIKSLFDFPEKSRIIEEEFPTPALPQKNDFHLYEDVNQVQGLTGTVGLPVGDNNALRLDVLINILGGSPSSRLYENLVLKKKLATHINASYWMQKEQGPVLIRFRTEEPQLEKLRTEIEHEIEKIQEKPVSETELKRFKNKTRADFIFSAQTPSQQAEQIGYWESIGQLPFLLNYLEMMENVTTEQLLQTARSFFGKREFVTGTVLPEKNSSEKKG